MITKDRFIEIKTGRSLEDISDMYNMAITKINKVVAENDYIVKVNGAVSESVATPKLDHLTWTGRKKFINRLNIVLKKDGLRTINMFFHVAYKMGIIDEKIKVEPSTKEQEIIKLRALYKMSRARTEEIRLQYRDKKKGFYTR